MRVPPYSVPSSIACSIVSSITIYEVGSNVGIPDPQYFNKQFRKVTGISPSRYRDDNQEYLSNIPNELSTKEGRWQES